MERHDNLSLPFVFTRSVKSTFRFAIRHFTRSVSPFAILLIWSIFLFGYGISVGTLYRTEALRAIIGREALHGSWLMPTLYGEPFLSKPPGMYAAIAAASIPFGDVTAVSARLPSAIAATITVFLFFLMFRRVVELKYALAGAMLMPVSFLWLDRAPSAEIDMLQLAWVSAALLCLLRAVEVEESLLFPSPRLCGGRAGWGAASWWVSSLLCVTAGFLTKWTAPAFFYLAAVPFLIWRRRLSLLWSWRHLLAGSVALGLCALWVAAVIQQAGWPALRDTVFAEAAQRFGPHQSGRPYPWVESLSYPLQIMAANLPWSLLALFACRSSFLRQWDVNGRRLLQLLHCWTWPNLLFWSLPAQHHVRYSMPMCPGLVGLGVMVAIAWARSLNAASRSKDDCKLQIANCKLQIEEPENGPRRRASKTAFPRGAWERDSGRPWEREGRSRLFNLQFAICNLQFAIFLSVLCVWSLVKILYVEAIVPPRTALREVRENAARLAELVPPDETLYLGKLKDEGVLFYYNRPVRRLHVAPQSPRACYAVLIEAEAMHAARSGRFEVIERLKDQQGDPIILVRFHD
jgi:Dolichyl-phosphate-mannose-protein mannosyltransferase